MMYLHKWVDTGIESILLRHAAAENTQPVADIGVLRAFLHHTKRGGVDQNVVGQGPREAP
jgi:hypothetical protein